MAPGLRDQGMLRSIEIIYKASKYHYIWSYDTRNAFYLFDI